MIHERASRGGTMADSLTPQQIAEFRLAGWHAAENGEPDDLTNQQAWRDGWHLRRFGVLPSRSDARLRVGNGSAAKERPVAVLRRLILASIEGNTVRSCDPHGRKRGTPAARSVTGGQQPHRLVSVLQ